ncbi:MAG: hypothetical protein E3J56_01365 [Candidatus Aminicenantes bacterium]|nr:MAG: hypothetical protein E3J56_01365 [Candidatus Aminicenantes bacterium]
MRQVIKGVGGINANLSPDAFHRWATHYYKCKQDFRSPHKFSPVPYFLLCRAIELEIKSIHLRDKKQTEVKEDFGHDILKAYEALSEEYKILEDNEIKVLKVAKEIYCSKGFEYFNPEDALTGFSKFPDLNTLDTVVKKLINHNAPGVSPL